VFAPVRINILEQLEEEDRLITKALTAHRKCL